MPCTRRSADPCMQAEKVMRDAIPALLTWLQTFRRDAPDQAAALEVRDQKHGTRMEAVSIPASLSGHMDPCWLFRQAAAFDYENDHLLCLHCDLT